MDRRKEVFVNNRPEIARIDRRESKKNLFERLNEWVDTVMPDRFSI